MSMPKIPEQPHRPTLQETFIDLMESIALEELSIANLLNSEADKIHAFIGEKLDFPTKPSNKEILLFKDSTLRLLEAIIFKQRLMIQKMYLIKEISFLNAPDSKPDSKPYSNRGTLEDIEIYAPKRQGSSYISNKEYVNSTTEIEELVDLVEDEDDEIDYTYF